MVLGTIALAGLIIAVGLLMLAAQRHMAPEFGRVILPHDTGNP